MRGFTSRFLKHRLPQVDWHNFFEDIWENMREPEFWVVIGAGVVVLGALVVIVWGFILLFIQLAT